jgi:hypothetical protein
VIITDVNDEIPMFRSKSYLAEVNENAQVNTPVTFLNSAVPEVFDHDQVIIDSGLYYAFMFIIIIIIIIIMQVSKIHFNSLRICKQVRTYAHTIT